MMLKLKNLLKYSFVSFALTNTLFVNACTIFMANDGRNVWIGNNEDELQNVKYRMWYYPRKKRQLWLFHLDRTIIWKTVKWFFLLKPTRRFKWIWAFYGLYCNRPNISSKRRSKEKTGKTSGNWYFEKM